MARHLVFPIVSIVFLTCISASWGQTCNWTSHETPRQKVSHEKTMLDGWIDLANGFVHAVAPKDLTALDLTAKLVRGKEAVSVKEVIQDLLRMEVAFAACFFLGLIYFLTMGSGWSCFLCCRCCGNCGANKTQRQTKTISSRRYIYVVFTIIVLGFLSAALTCAFMANEEMYWLMKKGNGSIQEIIDKVELYVNDTQEEIHSLDGCFEKTRENITYIASDEGIKLNLADPLIVKINEVSKPIIDALKKLDTQFKKLKDLKVKVSVVKAKEKNVGELSVNIQQLKGTCPTPPSGKDCKEIIDWPENSAEFDEQTTNSFSQLPDNVDHLFDLIFLREYQTLLDEISDKIVQESKNSRNDVINEINSFTKNKDIVEQVDKEVAHFHKETNYYEKEIDRVYSKFISEQEDYRYWGVFGLIMFVTLPSGLLFLGLCCGLLGSKSGRYPSERSGLSHCGGCTLMASVYLMFILGSLAMLFTVAFFQVGGHAEAYGCRYLYEKDLTTVNKVAHLFLPEKNDTKLLENLKSLNLGEIVSKCDNDAAIFQAIPSIENMVNVDLAFDKEVDKIEFGGYEEKINEMIDKALRKLKSDIDQLITIGDINALQNLLGITKHPIIIADKAKAIIDLEHIKALVEPSQVRRKDLLEELLKILKDLQEASTTRGEILSVLGTNGEEIAVFNNLVTLTVNKIKIEVEKITPTIVHNAKKMVKAYCDNSLAQVKDQVKIFANETTETIKTKVGKCGTLFDAFSLGRHFACREILGPLNALWFSLGACCFLFLFAIPFATKLSKHFYIMDEDEDSYVGMESLHGHHINGYAEHQAAPLYKGGNNFSRGPPRPTHHQNGAYEPDIEDRWTRY